MQDDEDEDDSEDKAPVAAPVAKTAAVAKTAPVAHCLEDLMKEADRLLVCSSNPLDNKRQELF